MNDTELRALVRDAVRRHLGGAPPAAGASQPASERPPDATSGHVSHGVYVALVNTTDRCVIEPSVPCEHCGYCKSHGY